MAGGRRILVVIVVMLGLAGVVSFPGSPAGAVTGPNYTVFSAVTLSLCGVHNFGDLVINSGGPGGTIRVASVASNTNTTGTGPDCPAGSENELMIRADNITNHGVIDADAVQAPPFTPALAPCDPPYQPPTGNSGGGHGFTGGHGSTGVGGSPYDVCALGIAGSNSPGLNPGAPGAGTGAGGRGGGVIVLVAHGSLVSDGQIRADGEAGTPNTTGACAFGENPTTGTPAPRGGGAGGRIVLAGRDVDLRGTTIAELRARGGPGGASNVGPSGGGAGGVITVMGPLKYDEGWSPAVAGGAAGTDLCPNDPQSLNAEAGGEGTWQILGKVLTEMSTQGSAASPTGVRDVATIVGAGPTGTVTFRLFSDSGCTSQVFTSTNPVDAMWTATSGDSIPTAAGTYYWTADYSGDAANEPATSPCNAPNESVTITKVSPSIATQSSTGGMAGAPVRDVATLSGGATPTGTVTFRLFSDDACTTQLFTSTVPVSGSTATSEWFTPAAPGTYRWTAVYNGDGLNNAATSPCNAPNESVTITPFQAPPATQTVTGDFMGPVTVNAGQSVAIVNARVVGPVTVNAGGSLTITNSQVTGGVTANAPSFLSVCGAQVSAAPSGVALSVTNAPVPVRIGDPAAGCAGNRFAGRVVLTANLALTFGANIVSQNATIDANGPGSTVIKANNVTGTLGCTGNNPAPTNAGQPNTAGVKTGQCAAL